MGDCPGEYLEFINLEEKYAEDWKTGVTRRVIAEDGSYHAPWSDLGKNLIASGVEEVDVPFQKLYPEFPTYLEDWHGATFNEEKKAYGYYENQNAKWDWYSIGGRWAGFFRVKPGVACAPVERHWMDSDDRKFAPSQTSQARKGDIDFDAMMDADEEEAMQRYHTFHSIIDGTSYVRWEEILAKHPNNNEAARDEYNAQKEVALLREADFYFDYEVYFLDEEAFRKRSRMNAVTTFAVLHNNEWIARGEMGWFGCVSNEKDHDKHQFSVWELIQSLPDDMLLTIVDCHI